VLFPEVFRDIGALRLLVFGIVLLVCHDIQAHRHLAGPEAMSHVSKRKQQSA
jgi:hypothetical protein